MESLLRLKLVESIKKIMGNNWFQTQIQESERLDIISEELNIIKNRKRKNLKIDENILINEANFGFWVEFFNKKVYKDLKGSPIKSFSNLPKTLKRKEIYSKLCAIKELRNNIYHHKDFFINDLIKDKQNITYLLQVNNDIECLINALDPSALILIDKKFESTLKSISEIYS
ncbi:MAG: hypothetical protein EPO58_12660 [Chitinophagaceae bacterium]|nr:MAG: hypothetical protein EPO58_12660 [Chitinophagaceae bacterium]